MAHAIIFPKLGQTMEEGAIVQWLKKEGDPVAKGDILFEIETDKANLEVESFFEGVMLKIFVREGITVPVNTVVGYVGAAGEKVPDQPPPPPTVAQPPPPVAPPPHSAERPKPPAGPSTKPPPSLPTEQAMIAPTPAPAALSAPVASRLIISPRARTLARECCINPANIRGSGANGRIVEKDIRAYLDEAGYSGLRISPAAKRLAANHEIDILSVRGSGDGGRIMIEDIKRAVQRKPVVLSRMRQVIAKRLTQSKQTIPHFYVTVKVDVTELTVFRTLLKERGVNYSLNDFVLEAVILALQEFPVVNSVSDGTTVTWHGDVNLGMAVSVDNGLVVPVIRAAQLLTMEELRAEARQLAERARSGKLTPDEMSGSSFTVSNMGMLNIDQFTAIINPGEAAILAVSSARQTPAVVHGEIKVRSIMAITLSADHRIVDGSIGAQFVNAIRDKLENLELWRSLI